MNSSFPSQIFRVIIPEANNRTIHSLETLPKYLATLAAAYGSYFLLGYCAHSSTRRLFRLTLFPFVVLLNFHHAFAYRREDLTRDSFTWGLAVGSFFILVKSLDYTFSPEDSFKRRTTNGQANALIDAINSGLSMRGLERPWSRGLYVPFSKRSPIPKVYLRQTVFHALVHFLIFDASETMTKFATHMGFIDGSILRSTLSFPLDWLASLIIVIALGQLTYSALSMEYDIFAIIAVGLFGQNPMAWPASFDNPWKSTSLQDLWSRRWHQMFRRTFIVLGGRPGYWIAGRVGFVIGVFFASGIVHELASYTMGHGLEWGTVVFFILQAAFLLLERAFECVSARKVGGWTGRVWVYIVVLGSGHIIVETWMRRFYGAAVFYPPYLSPTRWVLKMLGLPTPEGS